MKVSARNRLPGTVKEVTLGSVMAIVKIQVGDNSSSPPSPKMPWKTWDLKPAIR